MKKLMLAAVIATTLCACSSTPAVTEPQTTTLNNQAAVTLIPTEKDVAIVAGQTSAASPVIGGIDGITGTLKTDGKILVVGWAVDLQLGSPVTRVDVVLDGKTSVQAELGDDRPDVVKALARNDAKLSGWVATISLANVPAGPHTLSVLVYDTNQQAHILPFTYPLEVLSK